MPRQGVPHGDPPDTVSQVIKLSAEVFRFDPNHVKATAPLE